MTTLHYEQKNYNTDNEPEVIMAHHMNASRVRDTVPQWWDAMDKIVTVRNPWDLLASKYYHMKKLNVVQVDTSTFVNFCNSLLALRGTLNPGRDYYMIDGDIVAKHIIPAESMYDHLYDIFEGDDLPSMPTKNIGGHDQTKYRELYTDDINAQIMKDFKFEIDTFGYKF
jgi:hypothetical protein